METHPTTVRTLETKDERRMNGNTAVSRLFSSVAERSCLLV